MTGWIDGQYGSKRQIIFPGLFEEAWEFDEIEEPFCLFNAIEKFKEKVFVLPSFPFQVSKKIFEQSQPYKLWLSPDEPEIYWRPFIQKTQAEIIWTREPIGDEGKSLFVHSFDKRMMFLSAARNCYFGEAGYEEIEGVKLSSLDKKTCGLIELEKPVKFAAPMFPEIAEFLGRIYPGQKTFYTGELAAIAEYISGDPKIKTGWVWTKPARMFEKWAVTIGTAIKETRGSDSESVQAVNQSLKKCYVKFFGWLGRLCDCGQCTGHGGGSKCKRRGFAAELYRPDWRGLIVSTANANLLRNVFEVFKFSKKLPVAIYHDCLMYFSDNENPVFDFQSTSLLDQNKFTLEGTIDAQLIRSAIAEGKNAGQLDSIRKAEVAKNA